MKHEKIRTYALLLVHLPCLAVVLGVLPKLLRPLELSTNGSFAVIVACGAVVSVVITAVLARQGKSILAAARIVTVFLLLCFLVSFTPLFGVLGRIMAHIQGEAIAMYLLCMELYTGGVLLGMPAGYLAARLRRRDAPPQEPGSIKQEDRQ